MVTSSSELTEEESGSFEVERLSSDFSGSFELESLSEFKSFPITMIAPFWLGWPNFFFGDLST